MNSDTCYSSFQEMSAEGNLRLDEFVRRRKYPTSSAPGSTLHNRIRKSRKDFVTWTSMFRNKDVLRSIISRTPDQRLENTSCENMDHLYDGSENDVRVNEVNDNAKGEKDGDKYNCDQRGVIGVVEDGENFETLNQSDEALEREEMISIFNTDGDVHVEKDIGDFTPLLENEPLIAHEETVTDFDDDIVWEETVGREDYSRELDHIGYDF